MAEPSLTQLLRDAADNAERRLARALAPYGVTAAEWRILATLYEAGAVPPSVLAGRIGLTRGAVTRAVDRLRAKALVVRAAGRGDARFQTIALTGAGVRLVPVLEKIAADNDAMLAAELLPDAPAALVDALSALVGKK